MRALGAALFARRLQQEGVALEITRRKFLKISGYAAAGAIVTEGLGFDLSAVKAYAGELRVREAKQTTTICCFCSVGCGILVHTIEGKVINTEGDPEHPISEGALCPKGGALSQIVNNESRLRKPRYRAPGSAAWKEVEWDWALDQIARRVKDTRDRTFRSTSTTKIRQIKAADTPDESGLFPEMATDVEKAFVVNRTEGLAQVGSAALDNEECYLLQKTDALLGAGLY